MAITYFVMVDAGNILLKLDVVLLNLFLAQKIYSV